MKITRDPFGECVYIEGVAYHKEFFKFMAERRPWETGESISLNLVNTEQGTPCVNHRVIPPRRNMIDRVDAATRRGISADDLIALRRLARFDAPSPQVVVDEAPADLASGHPTAPNDGMAEAAQVVRWVGPEPLQEEAERPF